MILIQSEKDTVINQRVDTDNSGWKPCRLVSMIGDIYRKNTHILFSKPSLYWLHIFAFWGFPFPSNLFVISVQFSIPALYFRLPMVAWCGFLSFILFSYSILLSAAILLKLFFSIDGWLAWFLWDILPKVTKIQVYFNLQFSLEGLCMACFTVGSPCLRGSMNQCGLWCRKYDPRAESQAA